MIKILGENMKKTIYNKLVRDKIPQIIEEDGKTYSIDILSDEDYNILLDEKLTEELFEYQQSKDIEELADMYEVMLAIVKLKGYTQEQFEQIRKEKLDRRGGFMDRVFLKEVFEN